MNTIDVSSPSEPRRRPSVGLFALVMKFGPKLGGLLLKFGKTLKLGKAGLAVATAGSYSYLFSPAFAALLMASLFIHESGHIWAMKRYGLKTKGIYFIPFVGGAAVAESAFPTRKAEVVIALMGPIWGFGTALCCAALYGITANPLWAGASAWIALVNLFNLLPIHPLDGGRVFRSIAFSIHSRIGIVVMGIGVVASTILCVILHLPIFAFIALIGFGEMLSVRRMRFTVPVMPPLQNFLAFASYAIVVGSLLTLMSSMNHVPGAKEAFDVLTG